MQKQLHYPIFGTTAVEEFTVYTKIFFIGNFVSGWREIQIFGLLHLGYFVAVPIFVLTFLNTNPKSHQPLFFMTH